MSLKKDPRWVAQMTAVSLRVSDAKVETDDCDFVLYMLQTLAMRNYDPDVIAQFGFVITLRQRHSTVPCKSSPCVVV